MGRLLCSLMWLSVINTSFKNYDVKEAEIELSSRGPTGCPDGVLQGVESW